MRPFKFLFPTGVRYLESRYEDSQQRDQGEFKSPSGRALDIETAHRGLRGVERDALEAIISAREEAAYYKGVAQSALQAEARTHEIHEGHAKRKHELALAHIETKRQFGFFAVLKYRVKWIGICCVAGAVIIFIVTHWDQEMHHTGAAIYHAPPVIIHHRFNDPTRDFDEIRPARDW